MSISVHTNQSALVALQNLNKTNDQLASAQNRISTGLKVQGPKDNASVWGIAQSQRADIGALGAVKMSLDRAQSISDVAISAGETISDLLLSMKEKVTAAFKLILSDPAVKGILVNIFGGIMKCDIIADGIVAAAKEVNLSVPLVVRLEGTNVQQGKDILANSGLPIVAADDLGDAAKKIVAQVKAAA